MRDYYIPDLTERYPEGFDGVDMFAPYDPEAAAWDAMERDYLESERKAIDQINRAGYEIIKQDAQGWTFAETREELILCTIKGGEIISLYDTARNKTACRESMLNTWQEIANEEH